MYSLLMIGHYIYVSILLAAGFILFIGSCVSPANPLRMAKQSLYYTILAGIALSFVILIGAQGKKQLYADEKLAKMAAFFDTRLWLWEDEIQKGAIFDRSGLHERALAVSERDEQDRYIRRYPFGESSGHIVGYTNRARGRAGFEAVFFPTLIGSELGYLKNVKQYISNRFLTVKPEGAHVYLTIDSRLQQTCYAALNGRKGAVVVLDPGTGEVLAMVSSPGFSPEAANSEKQWRTVVNRRDDAPLFNRAIQGLYPPGSLMKFVIAAAALESGITPSYFSGAKGFTPASSAKPIHEHEYSSYGAQGKNWIGHGMLSLAKAMQKSSNVYFARLSLALDRSEINRIVNRFKFNTKISWNTSSDALSENFGVTPSYFPDLNALTPEEVCWSALGQYNVLVTPMHVALMTAVIANGGTMYRPSIELGRFPKGENKVISTRTVKNLRKMMRNVVVKGTGYRANIKSLEIAGKTGTAETGNHEPHSWFSSFAPVNDAKLVVSVIVENGGFGGIASTGIARRVYSEAARLGYFSK